MDERKDRRKQPATCVYRDELYKNQRKQAHLTDFLTGWKHFSMNSGTVCMVCLLILLTSLSGTGVYWDFVSYLHKLWKTLLSKKNSSIRLPNTIQTGRKVTRKRTDKTHGRCFQFQCCLCLSASS